MNDFKTKSHSKFLLQFHLIFVCKYRKRLLVDSKMTDDVKRLSKEICLKHCVNIRYMETDKDHVHYMIETHPNINLSNLVKTMKSYVTFHLWKNHRLFLFKQFWKEHTFFSDEYFISSIGNVSEDTLKDYIENQGK